MPVAGIRPDTPLPVAIAPPGAVTMFGVVALYCLLQALVQTLSMVAFWLWIMWWSGY